MAEGDAKKERFSDTPCVLVLTVHPWTSIRKKAYNSLLHDTHRVDIFDPNVSVGQAAPWVTARCRWRSVANLGRCALKQIMK